MTIIQSVDDRQALSALSAAILPFRTLSEDAPLPLSLLVTFIAVAKHGRITVNDIAKATGLKQSATTRQLQDLSVKNRIGGVGYNLVEQKIEGIYTVNSLTPKGHALATRMAAAMRRAA